ncbi:hypothetical protein GJ496_003614 [Pomphorhynchus laevis]|nr:hypothetical protein GJ496_003614 [Pomphorhynchus laevis]
MARQTKSRKRLSKRQPSIVDLTGVVGITRSKRQRKSAKPSGKSEYIISSKAALVNAKVDYDESVYPLTDRNHGLCQIKELKPLQKIYYEKWPLEDWISEKFYRLKQQCAQLTSSGRHKSFTNQCRRKIIAEHNGQFIEIQEEGATSYTEYIS